ncbi:histidine-type phosphatase, partial [Escherichia coli]|nr:histidine-type phosphatase [Escherichia coli]
HYVRASYRAQSLSELRAATAKTPYHKVLPIAGCKARGIDGLCTLSDFLAKLRG